MISRRSYSGVSMSAHSARPAGPKVDTHRLQYICRAVWCARGTHLRKPGRATDQRDEGGAIPTTSRRATTRPLVGGAWLARVQLHRGPPTSDRAVGLRQVDGMALEGPCARIEADTVIGWVDPARRRKMPRSPPSELNRPRRAFDAAIWSVISTLRRPPRGRRVIYCGTEASPHWR